MNTESRLPEGAYKPTWQDSLRWLTLKTGKRPHQVDPSRLRSQALALAPEEILRLELHNQIKGPPRAAARDFAATLGRLSLHSWRPEVTPQQAILIAADFQHDLADATAIELEWACEQVRTRPGRTYPSPGDLLELLRDVLRERKLIRIGAQLVLKALDYEAPPELPLVTIEQMQAIKERLLGPALISAPTAAGLFERSLSIRHSTARQYTESVELLEILRKKIAKCGPKDR
jgi:hypothetical protein